MNSAWGLLIVGSFGLVFEIGCCAAGWAMDLLQERRERKAR